jgi:CDP-glucose 4,6-dehydratase
MWVKVDASKARTRLGWNSRLDLDMALAWTIDWYQAQLKGEEAASITIAQIARYGDLGRSRS